MRLVHVVTVADSLVFFTGQIEFMRRRGFEVQIVCSPDPRLDEFGRREQIQVHGVPMARRPAPATDLRALAQLVALLRSIRPEIVHAHFPKAGFLGMLAATLSNVPVRIYQLRGLVLESATGPRRSLLTAIERASCGMAHHVLCNSQSLRAAAIESRVCAPRKLEVLLAGSSNGVDARGRFNPGLLPSLARQAARASLNIPNEALIITFAGRLVRDKGIEDLLDAWQELRQRFSSARLLLVGPVETGDAISIAARAAIEADPQIHAVGLQTNMPALYAASDLVVLPSYREGFPNVLLEAACMQVPVVATRVTGCVDAVSHGVTGLLVPPKQPRELARAMATYLADPGLRARHGAAARARALELFDRERLWNALESTYRRFGNE